MGPKQRTLQECTDSGYPSRGGTPSSIEESSTLYSYMYLVHPHHGQNVFKTTKGSVFWCIQSDKDIACSSDTYNVSLYIFIQESLSPVTLVMSPNPKPKPQVTHQEICENSIIKGIACAGTLQKSGLKQQTHHGEKSLSCIF